MKCLENLLGQEQSNNKLEGFLVFYSCAPMPSLKPMSMSPGGMSAYADSLNKQFGIPSPSVKPRAPSSLATAETFNPSEILQALNKPYPHKANEEELAYANSLSQQFNAPSTVIKPVTSHAPSPQTFNPMPLVDAVKNPFCSSSSTKPFSMLSLNKTVSSPAYKPLEFKPAEPDIKNFKPLKNNSYKGGVSNKDEIFDSKPFKYFDSFRKKEVNVFTKGVYNKNDFSKCMDFFEDNRLPKIYNIIKKKLHMKPDSINTITLTNPSYLKSGLEEGPNFLRYLEGSTEIRLPITPPKSIPFVKVSREKYEEIALNCFFPHEQSHANINEKYGKIKITGALSGFNEHLANTMAKESLGNPYIKAETEYQNLWAKPSKEEPEMVKDYSRYLVSKNFTSRVPANTATINMLGNSELEKQNNNILNITLEKIYPDNEFREQILNETHALARSYQIGAVKLLQLSKKGSLLSNFKAKNIWSDMEKQTFKFSDDLK